MKEGRCLGELVLGLCDPRNVHPPIGLRGAQIKTSHALVCSGLGMSLIPAMATQRSGENLTAYRLMSSPDWNEKSWQPGLNSVSQGAQRPSSES
jgi:LysR family hydrogen peroxide-inducible transcriptional activator